MRQWVRLGQFRTFILSRVLKGLGCEFRSELDRGGTSVQNLYTIRSEYLARGERRLYRLSRMHQRAVKATQSAIKNRQSAITNQQCVEVAVRGDMSAAAV